MKTTTMQQQQEKKNTTNGGKLRHLSDEGKAHLSGKSMEIPNRSRHVIFKVESSSTMNCQHINFNLMHNNTHKHMHNSKRNPIDDNMCACVYFLAD